jgi:hypothetical protein
LAPFFSGQRRHKYHHYGSFIRCFRILKTGITAEVSIASIVLI